MAFQKDFFVILLALTVMPAHSYADCSGAYNQKMIGLMGKNSESRADKSSKSSEYARNRSAEGWQIPAMVGTGAGVGLGSVVLFGTGACAASLVCPFVLSLAAIGSSVGAAYHSAPEDPDWARGGSQRLDSEIRTLERQIDSNKVLLERYKTIGQVIEESKQIESGRWSTGDLIRTRLRPALEKADQSFSQVSDREIALAIFALNQRRAFCSNDTLASESDLGMQVMQALAPTAAARSQSRGSASVSAAAVDKLISVGSQAEAGATGLTATGSSVGQAR